MASACTALAARSSGRRWAAAGAGLLAGLAALTRLNGLVLVPIVAALALPPTLPWRRRVVHIAVPVVVAALRPDFIILRIPNSTICGATSYR